MTPNPIPLDQLEWERTCPEAITSDTIWTLDAYRSSVYLLDLARADIRDAVKRGLSPEIASQLLRAVTSVSANLAEGYSRSTRGDRPSVLWVLRRLIARVHVVVQSSKRFSGG